MDCISYNRITGMHLELTTKCNALCPMCARNYKEKVRDKLPLVELSLENCKQIFCYDFIKQLDLISICGVFGDPINAVELIEIIDYFYECNQNIRINLYTNGSLHSTDWWKRLAKSIKNGYVIFGIDGIGKTNSIYRIGTEYDKVIENAKAFIKTGGKAKWDFIAFKHNENEIEQAKILSYQFGFSEFQVKKTSRFFKNLYENDPNLDSTVVDYGRHPIYSSNGEIVDYLELPENKMFINDSEKEIYRLIDKYGSLDDYFDIAKIDCEAIKSKGIFVSAFGNVYPCCTVYQQICYGSLFGVKDNKELNEYNLSKGVNLSAFDMSIKDIVEGEFFNLLQNSWLLQSICEGKPKSCCRTCGENLNFHNMQHSNWNKSKSDSRGE